MSWPFRVKSANGQPRPTSQFERRCRNCGASFSGLAAGKTGYIGVWSEWSWWCSLECAPKAIRDRIIEREG